MVKHGLALALLGFGALLSCAADAPKGEKVDHTIYGPYFEKNTSNFKGDSTYLVLTNMESFDRTFGSGFTMGPKPKLLPKDVFDKKLVVATIKRGNCIYEYKVESVTADKGTLYVAYKATAGKENPSATFASPLVVAVDKEKLTRVVFVENGKEVSTKDVGK